MSEERPTFVLTIRALPNTDAIQMLRQLLKRTLRQHRFQCLTIREIPALAGTSTPDDRPANKGPKGGPTL
jgi:hypothetical protein